MQNDQLVCIDIEATGLDPKTDKIIEVAIVQFTLKENGKSFETLIDPQRTIPPASEKIHHIKDKMVTGKPLIRNILPTIKEFLTGKIIVGHGIQWDIDCLINASNEYHIPLFDKQPPTIDTLRFARLYGQSPYNSLKHLRTHFNIEDFGQAHRAMNDVLVNIELFRKLCADYKKSIPLLMQRLEKPIMLKKMPLGKHKGRLFSEMPLDYLYWASRQKFDNDLLYSIRYELRLRKKRKSFLQDQGPFSEL